MRINTYLSHVRLCIIISPHKVCAYDAVNASKDMVYPTIVRVVKSHHRSALVRS